MAEPTPSSEAVVRVAASEKVEKVRPGPTNVDQQRANTLRVEMAEKGARKTLEDTISLTPKKGEITALIDENLGTEIDPENGEKVRKGKQRTEHKTAITSVDNLFAYIETGKVSTDNEVQVRADIGEIFRMYPGAEDIIRELGSETITDSVLNDPEFRVKLQERLTEIKGKKVAEIDPGAESAFKEAQRAEAAKQREHDRLKGEADGVRKGLKSFDSTEVPPGEKSKRIDKLTKTEIPKLEKDSKNAEAKIRDLDRRIKSQETTRAHIDKGAVKAANYGELIGELDTEIANLEEQRDEQQAIVDTYDEAKSEKEQLIQEKDDLRQRKSELDPQEDRVISELDELHEQTAQAEVAFARAKKAHSMQEREFLLSLEDVYKDAAVKLYDDRIKNAEAAQDAVLAKELEKAKDGLEKQIMDQFSGKRWDEKYTKHGILRPDRQSVRIKSDVVDRDFAKLVTEGPEATVREILSSKNSGFTAAEIEEKMKDPEFKKQAQDMLVEQLVTRKIKTGKITESEAFIIGTSPWGAEVIDTAIAKNSAVQNSIDQLRDIGALKGDGVMDWIKNHPNKTFAAMLLSAIFSGGLALVALPVGLGVAGAASAAGGLGAGGYGIRKAA